MARFPVALAILMALGSVVVEGKVKVKPWKPATCDKHRGYFNKCLTKPILKPSLVSKYGLPNSAARVAR